VTFHIILSEIAFAHNGVKKNIYVERIREIVNELCVLKLSRVYWSCLAFIARFLRFSHFHSKKYRNKKLKLSRDFCYLLLSGFSHKNATSMFKNKRFRAVSRFVRDFWCHVFLTKNATSALTKNKVSSCLAFCVFFLTKMRLVCLTNKVSSCLAFCARLLLSSFFGQKCN
jgi:hypothetical protein